MSEYPYYDSAAKAAAIREARLQQEANLQQAAGVDEFPRYVVE